MVRKWLIKYWWVNESGKVLCSAIFGYISWLVYSTGQLPLAFVSGILFVLCMVFVCDTVTVLIRKIRGKPVYESK